VRDTIFEGSDVVFCGVSSLFKRMLRWSDFGLVSGQKRWLIEENAEIIN
jgi:hypothetical protein